MYAIVGCAGYFWSFQNTCGNVLLNFPEKDYLVAAARISLILVLMGSYPLLILPCRSTFHRLLVVISEQYSCFRWYNSFTREMEQPLLQQNIATNSGEVSLLDPLQSKLARIYPAEAQYYNNENEPNLDEHYVPITNSGWKYNRKLSPLSSRSQISNNDFLHCSGSIQVKKFLTPERVVEKRGWESNNVVHVYSRERGKGGKNKLQMYDSYVDLKPRSKASSNEPTRMQRFCLTTVILALNLLIGLMLDAIMIVWTILGATISFTIAFTLPSLFFLKLNWSRSSSEVSVRRKVVAVGMLGSSITFSLVCTAMVVLNLSGSPCPPLRS